MSLVYFQPFTFAKLNPVVLLIYSESQHMKYARFENVIIRALQIQERELDAFGSHKVILVYPNEHSFAKPKNPY